MSKKSQVLNSPLLFTRPVHQKVDSTRAFQLLWFTWRIIGMNPPTAKHYRILYYIYAAFIAIFSFICLPATLLINLYFIDNVERLLGNLSLSITITVSALKFFLLFSHRNILKKRVIEFLEPLDQRCASNAKDQQHIVQAIRICRIFYWTFLLFIYFTAIGFSTIGLINHRLPYDGWFPNILQNVEENFWLAFIYQNLAQIFTLLQNTTNDIYPQCYLAVMIGHTRALVARIRRIGNDGICTQKENFDELLRCIQDHKNVLGSFFKYKFNAATPIHVQFAPKMLQQQQQTQVRSLMASSLAQPPLDSNVAFRLLWFNWRFIGMSPPEERRYRIPYYCYSAFVATFSTFCLPASLFLNLLFIDNFPQLLTNLSISLTIGVASMKYVALFLHRNALKRVNNYLGPLDVRCAAHAEDRQYINDAIRISRIYYWSYLLFFFFCASGYNVIGITNHRLVYDGWFPPIFRDAEFNYLLAFVYQDAAQVFTIFLNITNDIYPQCYLAVLVAQLRALCARIRRIGQDDRHTKEENFQELLNCIKDHKNLLGYFDCIRPIISRTILLQFLITAFVLCITAINFIVVERDAVQQLINSSYLVLVVTEVFPCCWYVNLMLQESNELTNAMYACNWYAQHQKFRRTLIIFMQRSQKVNVILAGNLAPVTLQTFLATIRFSFSMYTIMSKMKI